MKKTVKKVEVKEEVIVATPVVSTATTPKVVLPITQEFGNGEMNLLRDKINELINSNR